MESRPAKRGFGCMLLGVPAPSPDLRVIFRPVPEANVQTLAAGFVKRLAEPLPEIPEDIAAKMKPGVVVEAPPATATLELTGYPPLHAEVRRFGQTAALVTWIHRLQVDVGTGARTGQVQAISLYLTGLDKDADNLAINRCAAMRLGDKPPPVSAASYAQLREDKRPLAVQVFCQPLARLDPSVRCGFLGFGVAFFGVFGVDEPEEDAASPAPEE